MTAASPLYHARPDLARGKVGSPGGGEPGGPNPPLRPDFWSGYPLTPQARQDVPSPPRQDISPSIQTESETPVKTLPCGKKGEIDGLLITL